MKMNITNIEIQELQFAYLVFSKLNKTKDAYISRINNNIYLNI